MLLRQMGNRFYIVAGYSDASSSDGPSSFGVLDSNRVPVVSFNAYIRKTDTKIILKIHPTPPDSPTSGQVRLHRLIDCSTFCCIYD
jgi:hypothetical protein